jgi:hypothetical protein
MSKEFLKMQKLAGVITESQYNEKKLLIENQELSSTEISNKMKSLEQNPDFQKRMEKFWNDLQSKLSPQDLKKFEQNILAAGVVQEEKNLNEDSFNKAFNIVQDKIQTLTEYSTIDMGDYDDAPDYGIGKANNKAEYIAGKALSLIGGAGQTIVAPGLAAALAGFGFASPEMAIAMIGGILGGTALRWLGDKLKTRSFKKPEVPEEDPMSLPGAPPNNYGSMPIDKAGPLYIKDMGQEKALKWAKSVLAKKTSNYDKRYWSRLVRQIENPNEFVDSYIDWPSPLDR